MDSGQAAVLDPVTPEPAKEAAGRPADLAAALLALGVTAVVAAMLWFWRGAWVAKSLGDTDDALRLVLVRDLISGRAGWWDQHFTRLQPPFGMDLHWSRLVDGGIVALESAFRLFLAPGQAELAARTAWPLLWLFPAILGVTVIARRLAGPLAGALCAALLITAFPLIYKQWMPGRIDHHGVQIALCLVALAGVVRGGRRGLALAGAATGLGLAVGVEALVFEALIGVGVALRFLFDPKTQRAPAAAYAVSLLASLIVLFLIQTPPARWGTPVCDALGPNLVGAACTACAGLLLTVWKGADASRAARLGGLVATAAVAAAVYAAAEPACLHGPLGQADVRLWPVWLAQVMEMHSLFRGFPDAANNFALSQIILHALAMLAWLWLGRAPNGRNFAWAILGACLAGGVLVEAQAVRMSFYTAWFSVPIIAAAVAEFGAIWLRERLIWTLLIVIGVSPAVSSTAIAVVEIRNQPKNAPKAAAPGRAQCNAPEAYARLGRLPSGLVLAEIDLGPYILATTPHSVVAAPYHRIARGILAADAALGAPPGRDEAAVRSLHADYVVECRNNAWYPRRREIGPRSLQVRLDRGQAPAWLQPLSRPDETLQVYRVRTVANGQLAR